MSGRPAGAYFCVVDTDPRFQAEVLRWYAVLVRVAGVDPGDLVVCEVDRGGRRHAPAVDVLAAEGVRVERIAPFHPRSPHCNKIAALARMAELGIAGDLVLCDTDLAVVGEARGMDIGPRALAGKIVDSENPPRAVLEHVFAEAGLDLPELVAPEFEPEGRTVAANLNAGLVVVPAAVVDEVVGFWDRWARWLLDRLDVFDAWMAPDQVSIALALTETGFGLHALDGRWNFPTGPVSTWSDRLGPSPQVLHYHRNLDRAGLLLAKGEPAVDRAIDQANGAIVWCWRRHGALVAGLLVREAARGTSVGHRADERVRRWRGERAPTQWVPSGPPPG